MLNQEDLKWIAKTSTDLNSLLQQIARYSDLARRHQTEPTYGALLGERVDLAAKTAQALFDRVTSQILAKTMATAAGAPAFTVLPPPVPAMPAPKAGVGPVARAVSPSAPVSILPRRSYSASAIPSDIKVKNPKGNRELLLLIEDETEVAELAGDMLADEGYRVITAQDGFEALKIYQRIGHQIGLVILDFFLPIMDGDAVFDELRALNPNIDVVLSSGFAEQHKISAMLAQGLRGFIPKPHTCEKLLSQVRSILDNAAQGVG